MASSRKKTSKDTARRRPFRALVRPVLRWIRLAILASVAVIALIVTVYALINPRTTLYMASEQARLGTLDHQWVDFDEIAPVMARSVVAAEDANFCRHWGFDMAAIRQVIEDGETRGASTISQQVVKNTYLWPARSWLRKALEALITPAVELVWTKQRILEVYLNVVEFDEGVFGIDAAAHHYFHVTPAELTADQAALLAAVLPNPKERSASNPGAFTRQRAIAIRDGARTIEADGRAACFSG